MTKRPDTSPSPSPEPIVEVPGGKGFEIGPLPSTLEELKAIVDAIGAIEGSSPDDTLTSSDFVGGRGEKTGIETGPSEHNKPSRFKKIIAGLTALALSVTGATTSNTTFHEGLGRRVAISAPAEPGVGGLDTSKTTPGAVTEEVIMIHDGMQPGETVISSAIIDKSIETVKEKQSQGFTAVIEVEGGSSDYPNFGKLESRSADASPLRANDSAKAIRIALDAAGVSGVKIVERANQNLLDKKQIEKLGSIANRCGYGSAKDMASAVLFGGEDNPLCVKAVKDFVRSYMGVDVKMKFTKQDPDTISGTASIPEEPPLTYTLVYNPIPGKLENPAGLWYVTAPLLNGDEPPKNTDNEPKNDLVVRDLGIPTTHFPTKVLYGGDEVDNELLTPGVDRFLRVASNLGGGAIQYSPLEPKLVFKPGAEVTTITHETIPPLDEFPILGSGTVVIPKREKPNNKYPITKQSYRGAMGGKNPKEPFKPIRQPLPGKGNKDKKS